MKLGMSSAGFYGRMETEDEASSLRQHFTLDVCEIFLQTRSEYARTFGETVKERLSGLPCVSVHPKGTQFEPDLFGGSPRQRQDAMETLSHVLDAGQALGASYYVFHGPSGVRSPMMPERIASLPERFAAMQALAKAHHMEILWENVNWCTLRNLDCVRSALGMIPDLHFVLDVKQAYLGKVDPFDMLHLMEGRVRHVHLLDWDENGKLCLPGEGVMDFPRLFRELKAQGYNGALILEPYASQTTDTEAVKRSLAYLRETMERFG
jgi:sugar phosphate isomerase/epimerase